MQDTEEEIQAHKSQPRVTLLVNSVQVSMRYNTPPGRSNYRRRQRHASVYFWLSKGLRSSCSFCYS
jgi:hypothetical protein